MHVDSGTKPVQQDKVENCLDLVMLTGTETHFGYEVSVLESLKAHMNELYSENVCCLRYFSRSMNQHPYSWSLPRVTLDAFLLSLLGHYSEVTGLHGFDVVYVEWLDVTLHKQHW